MDCCVEKPKDLGCITCLDESVEIPGAVFPEVLEQGDFKLRFEFNGQLQYQIIDNPLEGEPIKIKHDGLNEDYTYVGAIVGQDGNVIKFTHDNIEYDGFKIRTKTAIT